MAKIKLTPTPELESRSIVAEQKSLDSRSIVAKVDKEALLKMLGEPEPKVEKPKGKTSEAQRKAIQKYEQNFKRINCRLPLDLWHKIENTGLSANSIIISALEKYLPE